METEDAKVAGTAMLMELALMKETPLTVMPLDEAMPVAVRAPMLRFPIPESPALLIGVNPRAVW